MKAKVSVLVLTAITCCVGISISSSCEAKVKIRLGTLAPKGSAWIRSIERVRHRVRKDGIVLKIYPGGILGDEGEMVRAMRGNELHAAILTNIGLGLIDRSTIALQTPMMFRSYAELDYVRKHIGPKIAKALEAQGFVVLDWGDAGWVHFFSKTKAVSPNEFKKLKFFVWAGDPESEAAWRAAGFNPVPTSSKDVPVGLQTGRLEAFATPPLYALANQWFGLAPHMVALKWSPLNGATIISKKVWDKIDPEVQVRFKAIIEEETSKSRLEIRSLGDQSLEQMQKAGLNIHRPDQKIADAWKKTAESAYTEIRGKVVPEEYFDEVQRLVKEYRQQPK